MDAAKYRIFGSDYVGVFATASDRFVLVGSNIPENNKEVICDALKVDAMTLSISGSNLVGLFARANSNGIVVSDIILDTELMHLKSQISDLNIAIIESDLNALGSNVLANDKIAIINPEYSQKDMKTIGDALGVEVIKAEIDGFKTMGANNILTNKGFVINNKSTDPEKEKLDKATGFDSVRSTANVGSLHIGLSVIANTNGLVIGDSTTGYEMARIVEALE